MTKATEKINANRRKRKVVELMRQTQHAGDERTAIFLDICESSANVALSTQKLVEAEALRLKLHALDAEIAAAEQWNSA